LQEAFDSGAKLPSYTRVQVWKWWKEHSMPSTAAGDGIGTSSSQATQLVTSGEATDASGGVAAARRRLQAQAEAAACAAGGACQALANDDSAWQAELAAVTGAGFDAILSAPWYLNLGSYAGQDWKQYYAVDPTGFKGSDEQASMADTVTSLPRVRRLFVAAGSDGVLAACPSVPLAQLCNTNWPPHGC
jgi:hexosaminidase